MSRLLLMSAALSFAALGVCRAAPDGSSAGSSLPDGVKAPTPPTPAETTDLSSLGLPDNTHSPTPSGIDEPHANPDEPGKEVPPGEPAPQPTPVAAQSPAEAPPPAAQPPAQAAEPVPVPTAPAEPSGMQGFMQEVLESITALKEQNEKQTERIAALETKPAGEATDLAPLTTKVEELRAHVSDLDAKTLHEQELLSFRDRLDRSDQSVVALADRTDTLEKGYTEVAKVADSLRTADIEPRLGKVEAAVAKGGTGGDGTTLAKLFSGDEDTAKEIAAKLDHLWKQNGNA